MSSASRVLRANEGAGSAPRQLVRVPGPFLMRHGGTLPYVDLVYETWGRLGRARDNTLLLFTGLSPGSHAASSELNPSPGWWEGMIGPGGPIDTDRFHVVCFTSLGSCHGSTGPASVDPRTGRRYGLSFPVLTVEDVATAAHDALRLLGVRRVRAVVGSSLGGMLSLAYAILFPAEVDALVSISGACKASPFAIAIRSLQREAIRSDPRWRGGDYPTEDPPVDGLRVARKLGLISYRSAMEWLERFGRRRIEGAHRDTFDPQFEIEAYLEANAVEFATTFDANCYLYLSRAMDLFDASEHGGTIQSGLRRIQASRTLVVGVETDFLFPIEQQEEIASVLREGGHDARLARLPSISGHDSFLIDLERFGPVISEFLSEVHP